MDPAGFLDGKDGGTIFVTLVYDNNPTVINIPFASTTCKNFGNEEVKAELQNEIGVRGILPFDRPEVQLENGTATIKVGQYSKSEVDFKIDGWKGYEWKWLIYIKNFLLVLFAWIVDLSSAIGVWDKIQSKN